MSVHVLMVVASEDDGGMARVVHLLASRLPAYGCSVHVAVHREAPLTRLLSEAGVPYTVIPELIETPTRVRADADGRLGTVVRNLAGLPRAASAIGQLIRTHAFDVVYSHNTWSNYVTAAAIATMGAPARRPALVWHIHNDHSAVPVRVLDRLAARLGHVAAFVAVSQSIGAPFEDRRAPLTVVTNGIDVSACDAAARSPRLRSSLGLDAHVPVIAYAGRLVAHKGFQVFLAAARRAAADMPDLHAVILGGNPRHDSRDVLAALRSQIDASNLGTRIHVMGHVPDVERYLVDADIVAVPSVCADGFPLAAVEALCLGVPVVASNIGGLPELVRDGAEGVLVPAGDAAALAAAIVNLVRNPETRRRMSEAAKAARLRFDAAAMAERIASVLHRAAERGANRRTMPATS